MGWPGPLTRRQAVVWAEWFRAEWDRPGRVEQYVMLAAHEARHANRTRRPPFRTADYRLEFAHDGDRPRRPTAPTDPHAETAKLKKGFGRVFRPARSTPPVIHPTSHPRTGEAPPDG